MSGRRVSHGMVKIPTIDVAVIDHSNRQRGGAAGKIEVALVGQIRMWVSCMAQTGHQQQCLPRFLRCPTYPKDCLLSIRRIPCPSLQ